MAKPIKERGIKWTEKYGEKSSYLKQEMEEQIGPGSYFRWEGHDSSTGNDYYVVICPGYSKNHGYHFFAGLRKMPADHGASGHYFKSMREALNYAYDTWRVPKPDTMPAPWVPPTIDSIAGKDIILEGVHEASSDGETKVSWNVSPKNLKEALRDKEAMALRQMQGNFEPAMDTPRITPEHYCFAYMASPVTGFLPAMFSRKRIRGVDGQNFNKTDAANTVNDLYPGLAVPGTKDHRPDERPPILATCQNPPEEEFNKNWEGSVIQERLYDMDKEPLRQGKGKIPTYPHFKEHYKGDPGKVRTKSWGNTEIEFMVTIPSDVIQMSPSDDFLDRWAAQFRDAYRKTLYSQYEAEIEAGSPEASDLERMVDEASNKALLSEIDTDVRAANRYFRVIFMAKNYDLFNAFGREISQRVQAGTGLPHATEVKAKNTTTKNFKKLYEQAQYILTSPDIDDKTRAEVVKKYGLERGFDFDKPYEQKILMSGTQLLVYDDLGLPIAMTFGGTPGAAWQQEENLPQQKVRYVLKDPVGLVERNLPGFRNQYEALKKNWNSKQLSVVQETLAQFRKLAAANSLAPADPTGKPFTHKDVFDSRTVSPLLTNPVGDLLRVDSYGMPIDKDSNPVHPDFLKRLPQKEGMVPASATFHTRTEPIIRPYRVGATADRDPATGEQIHAARYWDTQRNAWVYGKLPEGVEPMQQHSGIPTLTPNAVMGIAMPDGSLYEMSRNEFMLYDPNSCGKFIPGNKYVVDLKPAGMQTMKTSGSMPEGMMITQQNHLSQFDVKTGTYTQRHENPTPFTESVPPELRGTEDQPKRATQKGRDVIFFNSRDAMNYLKRELALPDSLTDPFTELSTMDLKVIQETAQEGIKFYKENKEQYENWTGDPADAGYQKYIYGKTVSSCSGFSSIPAEVLNRMAKAKEDPSEALVPPTGDLYGLWITPPGGNEDNSFWFKDEMWGVWFSPSQQILEKRGKNRPAVQEYIRSGHNVEVRKFVDTRGQSFSLPSMATAKDEEYSPVSGSQNLLEYMRETSWVAEREDVERAIPEKELIGEEEALPEETRKGLEVTPEMEVKPRTVMPKIEDPFAIEKLPVPDAQPTPAPVQTEPNAQPQRPPAGPPATPPEPPSPRPKPTRRVAPKIRRDDPFAIAKCCEGLVRMADRFDREGRTAEADAADKALRFMTEVAKRTCPSQ